MDKQEELDYSIEQIDNDTTQMNELIETVARLEKEKKKLLIEKKI